MEDLKENIKLNGRVLLVDDDPDWLEILQDLLSGLKLKILTAQDGVEALLLLSKNDFDLAILDTNMPRLNGIELLKIMRMDLPRIPVILLSSDLGVSSMTADEVLKIGATVVLEKRQACAHLLPWVRTLLTTQNQEKKNGRGVRPSQGPIEMSHPDCPLC